MSDSTALLIPVAGTNPCGEDLSFSSALDEIARARQFDDPSLDQGEWVVALKEADWPLVARRCAELIASRSKDLRLAVWLAEAQAYTRQFRGLGEGLALLAGLCEHYWDGLYPLAEEGDHEQRSGNLAWLLARVPALVAAMPTAPDALADAQFCRASLLAFESALDRRLGADGPGFSGARDALDKAIHAIGPDAGLPALMDGSGATVTAMPLAVAGGALQGRSHALAQLRQVAEFFRRTEPHSPVAYLADKAAGWGELPLHLWLRAVVKDPAARAGLDELLGVPDPAE
ncbi:type VI secretion system protein TssA [Oxalobacteraceae bacterium]|nr:type VI secretion system protein TssA [Oxalobacteraceae bacterium]